eukprot:Gb_23189 [translate_table: standard]
MVKAKPKSVKFELTEARGAETHNQTGRLELAHAHKTTKAKQTACGIKEASFDEKNDGAVLSRSSKTIPSAILEVNLAAVAVQLKVRVKAADMPALLQEQAFRCARECLDSTEKLRCGRVALALKKEFDKSYGPAWHCIVGKSFGSFVTYSRGGFLYFSMEKVSILLFKTAVQPIQQ